MGNSCFLFGRSLHQTLSCIELTFDRAKSLNLVAGDLITLAVVCAGPVLLAFAFYGLMVQRASR